MIGRFRVGLTRIILLKALEHFTCGGKAAFNYITLCIQGILKFSQIVRVFQQIATIDFGKNLVIILLVTRQQIFRIFNLLLLKCLILCLFSGLNELGYARDDLVEVAGDAPLFAVHDFCVEITPIIQINVLSKSS